MKSWYELFYYMRTKKSPDMMPCLALRKVLGLDLKGLLGFDLGSHVVAKNFKKIQCLFLFLLW